MSVLAVPYHIDEHLSDFTLPIEPDAIVAPALPTAPDAGPWERMATLYASVADEVERVCAAGRRPLVVSGDCTTSLGIVAGLQRRDRADEPGAPDELGVVWFDAHGDLHTPESTASGYLGGMPLRMLLGAGDPTVADRVGLRPIRAERTVLVDGRDLDPPEEQFLASWPVTHLPVGEVDARTIPDGPLYLHIDADTCNPEYVPGLRFPAAGGPAPQAVVQAVRNVIATGRVVGIGLGCTWYPNAGPDAAAALTPLMGELLP